MEELTIEMVNGDVGEIADTNGTYDCAQNGRGQHHSL